jgi:glycosyltransferase involved in cell wall biosynthesis
LAVKEITDRIDDIHFDMITLRFDKRWPKSEKIGNINVYRVAGPKLFFPFLALFKALSLRQKNKYQVVWAIMANRAGFAALFFKILNPKIRCLLTLQEGDTSDYPEKRAGILWPAVKFLFHRIFTKADYIQTISNYLAVWARKMGFTGRLEIVPNGVDLTKFQIPNSKFQINHKSQISKFKQGLGISEKDRIIITTSRLVEKNAVGDVIEALKYLPMNVKFLILGSGPLENELKSKAASYNLETRVIFLGHVEPREVPRYLAISDIFVRPSLSEGLGSSFLEAMAAGIPIIATKVGGIPDFLEDGETGLFCEVKNPKSIAEKSKILLENGELRQKIVKTAQEMVEKNYDWDLIAEKMKNIFDKLL